MRKVNNILHLINIDAPGGVVRFLEQLRERTLSDEPWNLEENPGFLLRYLNYRSQIVLDNNLMVTSEDGKLAAFDTGLLTSNWDRIIFLLEKNQDASKPQPWTLLDTVVSGEGKGKLLSKLPPVPAAKLYKSVEELHYNAQTKPMVDLPHIMSRLERIPREIVSRALGKENLSDDGVSESVSKDPVASAILKALISQAIDQAFRRAEVDPYSAVPCYSPRTKRICFLLPLSFSDPETVDCSLVVDFENGVYKAVTILDLRESLSNARLLGRFSSSWWIQKSLIKKSTASYEG